MFDIIDSFPILLTNYFEEMTFKLGAGRRKQKIQWKVDKIVERMDKKQGKNVYSERYEDH